ncbi:hypothetical protein S83_054660, partial [Arachis hypogaea]
KAIIVSVSPQSRSSLAAHFDISPIQILLFSYSFTPGLNVKYLLLHVFKKLTKFFNSLGAIAIFDISCSRDFTLIKFCMEFMSRYKQSQLFDYEKNKSSLPMIASACPVTATFKTWLLDMLCREATLVVCFSKYFNSKKSTTNNLSHHKTLFIPRYGAYVGLEEIYHVTVMPCYDKMLEATRDDFVIQLESHDERSGNEDNMVIEVQSVLTTGDILELILISIFHGSSQFCEFIHFYQIFRCDAFSCRLTNINKEDYLLWGPWKLWRQIDRPLNFRNILNSNFQEVTLEA